MKDTIFLLLAVAMMLGSFELHAMYRFMSGVGMFAELLPERVSHILVTQAIKF